MKRILLIFVILVLFFSSSCTDKTDEGLKLKEVINTQDRKLEETLLTLDDEEGVYYLLTGKNKYIIFRSTKKSYKDVNYELMDNKLKIKFNSDSGIKLRQLNYIRMIQIYMIPYY